MKNLIKFLLAKSAKAIIAKQEPKIVAVTGSVGKTSTRNAIATVLKGSMSVRTPIKNYNNEFGVPLTIIGATSPGKSVFGWLSVLIKAWKLGLSKDIKYPRVLVLEYGADHAGDIGILCDIAQPDISVITAISPVHLSQYKDIRALIDEKTTLVRRVKDSGLIVLSSDDEAVLSMQTQAKASVVLFGLSESSEVKATDISVKVRQDDFFEPTEQFSEIRFNCKTGRESFSVIMPNLLSTGSIKASLAAVAVAQYLQVPTEKIIERLSMISSEPGRMNPIAGIKGTLILDDSYNAAPASMDLALDTLALFPRFNEAKRIAVLGKMAELGSVTEIEHYKIGQKAVAVGVDVLLAVGEPARDILRGAEATGKQIHTEYFKDSAEAGRWLDRELKKGDIVLIKGSESARMEKTVKDIMAEPQRASELLVRQESKWLN